jgi:hypothetical protein
MYKLTDAKRAINCFNLLIKDANDYVVDLIKTSILEEIQLDDKQLEQLNQIFFNIKDQISDNSLLTTIQNKKKKKKTTRLPSEYNLFMRENSKPVRENNPQLNNKEVLTEVARLWNLYKIQKVKEGETVKDGETIS